eukprot:1180930-Prorocentrum_minimum.AAC.4
MPFDHQPEDSTPPEQISTNRPPLDPLKTPQDKTNGAHAPGGTLPFTFNLPRKRVKISPGCAELKEVPSRLPPLKAPRSEPRQGQWLLPRLVPLTVLGLGIGDAFGHELREQHIVRGGRVLVLAVLAPLEILLHGRVAAVVGRDFGPHR